MTDKTKSEILQISKEFANGLGIPLNGSGWLITDPLSAYLNTCGFKNKLFEIPAKENRPKVLIIDFEDGTQFIPAGADLKTMHSEFENWQFI